MYSPLLSNRASGLKLSTLPVARPLAVVAGTLLMALCAHISLPVALSPVPATMQTFGLLLLAMTLGPAAAATAMVLYLLEGAAGMPVFSPQGLPGIAHLTGPTAGFLFAYPLAALVAGTVYRRLLKRGSALLAALAAGVAGLVPVFAIGVTWLLAAHVLPAGHVMQAAVLPFLPGEAFKLTAAAAVVLSLLRLRQRA